jgi:acyl dehydratase
MNEVWKKPPVSFETYQGMVGHEVGVSSWHLVDQNRIDLFADVIEDHQFIHIDPEREARNRVWLDGRARLFDDVAVEHHVLRGDAGHRGHHHGGQLRF